VRADSLIGALEAGLAIEMLDAADSRDAQLVGRLADLINHVYAVAEAGLWVEGAKRTTPDELAELIAAGEIAVARRDGEVAGSIRIRDVADGASEFGMLVAAFEQRGSGVGRGLVEFAEQRTRDRGRRALQLELLVPREWEHPSKEFLKGWYGRIGYRVIRTGSMADAYPHLAPLLATPCDLIGYEKPLDAAHS
jgi:GNAT superfamily N-acetyltransferase